MKLSGLLDFAERVPAIEAFVSALSGDELPGAPLGIHHAARPYVAAIVAHTLSRPLVVVTARTGRARQWVDDLRVWLPDEVPVPFFADGDSLP
jgi:hypothetical protein